MPSTEQLLAGLGRIANTWRPLAIAWHIYLAALSVLLVAGVRPARKVFGLLLSLPLLSVSTVAWLSGNPFNGLVYALLTLLLVTFSLRLTDGRIHIAPPLVLVPGIVLFLFGWVYPHFLDTSTLLAYLYAAPVGVVPCATLSVVVGLALILDGLGSRAVSLTLGLAGLFYGFTGISQFHVYIDAFLLAGAILLTIRAFGRRPNSAVTDHV